MATASELDKIKCNPIKERLATFRRLFESTQSVLDVASSSDKVEAVFSAAATTGTDQLLVATLVTNARSRQKPGSRPYPSSADRTGSLYPPFPNS